MDTNYPSIVSHTVSQGIDNAEKFAGKSRHIGICQDSRKTVDLVLDERTLRLIRKLKNASAFTDMQGCISTGKEANVYYGILKNKDGTIMERAVKVFKTSILVFKDRSRYISGDFRYQRGYEGSNPRKMVSQWAEKEFRNLKRMQSIGLRGPIPIDLRQHTFAMTFIGHDGAAASRLRDVNGLSVVSLNRIYIEIVVMMRLLFKGCDLVHGDLSEFNILLHQGHPYIIDVSQSMESDHPRALDFLKRDCVNITKCFRRMFLQRKLKDLSEESSEYSSYEDEGNKCDGMDGEIAESVDGADAACSETYSDSDDDEASSDTTPLSFNQMKESLNVSVPTKLRDCSLVSDWDSRISILPSSMLPVMSAKDLFQLIVAKDLPNTVLEAADSCDAGSWPVYDVAFIQNQLGQMTAKNTGDSPLTEDANIEDKVSLDRERKTAHIGVWESKFILNERENMKAKKIFNKMSQGILKYVLEEEAKRSEDEKILDDEGRIKPLTKEHVSLEQIFLQKWIPTTLRELNWTTLDEQMDLILSERNQDLAHLTCGEADGDNQETSPIFNIESELNRAPTETNSNCSYASSKDRETSPNGVDVFDTTKGIPTEDKKSWKKEVKAYKAHKRLTKLPKHVKKRSMRKNK